MGVKRAGSSVRIYLLPRLKIIDPERRFVTRNGSVLCFKSLGASMAFFCVGVIAFITTAYMIFVFPKVPGGESFSIKQMPEILKNKTLMGIFLVTFLFATSYYTGYSYIEPFLQKVAGLSANWVTTTLTIFGAAGLLGSFLFSHYYDKNKYLFIRLVMISVAAALLLLYPVSKAHMAVVVLCAFWGMAVMAFNVTFQSEIITYAPAAASEHLCCPSRKPDT